MSFEDGEAKATEHQVLFIETSAKVGFNIKALFRKVASALPGLSGLSADGTPAATAAADKKVELNLKPQTADQPAGYCSC